MRFRDDDLFEDPYASRAILTNKLTLEEIEIALTFLKRRFPRMPIQKIVSTLDNYHHLKQHGQLPIRPSQPPANSESRRQQSSDRMEWTPNGLKAKETAEQKKRRQEENLRLTAQLFCEGGQNYENARLYMPELQRTNYRNMLLSIANTTLKELLTFLRKECNITIKELTESQKITIKTMIISAHTWMGLKSVEALETLLKFISRKFINRLKLITKEQAINLYSVIAKRVNDKSLDLTSLEPPDDLDNSYHEVTCNLPSSLPSDDSGLLSIIAQTFLEFHDLSKMSNFLIRKYGLNRNWEIQSIESFLRQIITQGLKKLQKIKNRILSSLNNFAITRQLLNAIMAPEYLNLQYALVQLYLSKMQNKEIINSLCQQMNTLLNKHVARSISKNTQFEDSYESAISPELSEDEEQREVYQERPRSQSRMMAEDFIQEERVQQQHRRPPIDFSTFEVDEGEDDEILYFSD